MPDKNPQPDPELGPRPVAWITWALIGSTFAVYFVQLYEFHLHGRDVVGDALAFGPQAWATHRYWTLLTYAWVHGVTMFGGWSFAWLHIVIDMMFLFFFGPMLEEYIGHRRYLGLYLGGVIVSALVWVFFNTDPQESIIGASGAVCAVIAGVGTAGEKVKMDVYSLFFPTFQITLRTLVLAIFALEVLQMIAEWLLYKVVAPSYLTGLPGIGHTAHLGGALFGFIYVSVIRYIYRK
jgi:membrane associated rhomboid family serine protease